MAKAQLTDDARDDLRAINGSVRKMVLKALKKLVLSEAADGESCLDRVRDFRPDVLILDVSMLGGGPQLAKAAKELNPGMRIVVFSGRQDDQTRSAMLAAGADQYVVKTGRFIKVVL